MQHSSLNGWVYGVQACFSIAIINTMTNSYLHRNSSMKEVDVEIKRGHMEEVSYWFSLHGLLILLFYTTQAYLLWVAQIPTSNINHKNALQTCLQTNLMGAILQLTFPLPRLV